MMRASGELLLPEATEPPRDIALYDAFKKALLDAPEIYKDLTMTPEAKEAAVAAWRRGEEADIRPLHLDESVLAERLTSLKKFKQEFITDTSLDLTIRQVYRWRVNEAIANVHMQICAFKGDEEGYRRWGEFVYGKPNTEIYRAALDFVANDADAMIASNPDNPAVVEAARDVLDRIGELRGDRSILSPNPETFAEVRADHFRRDSGYYALLFSGVEMPSSGKVTNEQGEPILEHILKNNLKSQYELVDAPGAAWGVVHSRAEVERPAVYNMLWQRFVGLGPGHEIGSHLLEYENGRRGPLRILSDIGLDRYELGNEGRALIREQVVYNTFEEFSKTIRWRDVLRRAIAIGFAHGTDVSPAHKQAETYEFMLAIDRMYQTRVSPDDLEKIGRISSNKTETLLTRMYRGGVYLKDKVYLEGNVACYKAAEQKGAEIISFGDTGKHDIANDRHIEALQNYGVLPEAA